MCAYRTTAATVVTVYFCTLNHIYCTALCIVPTVFTDHRAGAALPVLYCIVNECVDEVLLCKLPNQLQYKNFIQTYAYYNTTVYALYCTF